MRGRPKQPDQVRVSWRVNKTTKLRVEAKVVKEDKSRNTPGKVVDAVFEK